MASKGGREKIKLESTAGTGHFYTTSKNKKTMPEKMSIMKFDPKARKHVEYKETKLKLPASVPPKGPAPRGFFFAAGGRRGWSCAKGCQQRKSPAVRGFSGKPELVTSASFPCTRRACEPWGRTS